MELELLNSIIPELKQNSSVLTGPGDDCAVVDCAGVKLLLAADSVTENIHFTADTAPELAGAKLVKRNLSDIAAMGGTPLWMLLTLADCGHDIQWLRKFVSGAEAAAEEFGVPITGGDTSSLHAPGFTASVTIIGKADTPVLRSGAKPGDTLYVTGEIGNSFLSQHHLNFTPHLAEGRFLAKYANAMMDISDGLLLDAARMAAASNVDIFIDPQAVPLRSGAALLQALSDGEDYGLLFCCKQDIDMEEEFNKHNFPAKLTRIGCVRAGNGKVREFSTGRPFNLEHHGYEH